MVKLQYTYFQARLTLLKYGNVRTLFSEFKNCVGKFKMIIINIINQLLKELPTKLEK